MRNPEKVILVPKPSYSVLSPTLNASGLLGYRFLSAGDRIRVVDDATSCGGTGARLNSAFLGGDVSGEGAAVGDGTTGREWAQAPQPTLF